MDIMAEGNETLDIMPEGNETLELKFRIFDGTDIDNSIVPQSVNDMKLIHGGRVLDNEKTLAESRVHLGDLTDGVITMHVVVRPSNICRCEPGRKEKSDRLCLHHPLDGWHWSCSIMLIRPSQTLLSTLILYAATPILEMCKERFGIKNQNHPVFIL